MCYTIFIICQPSFHADYTDINNITKIKTYRGYVRNLEQGVQTTLDPAGDLLWEKGKFFGNKPFIKNGTRYVYSQDYFNLFESLYKSKNSNPYYYKLTKD